MESIGNLPAIAVSAFKRDVSNILKAGVAVVGNVGLLFPGSHSNLEKFVCIFLLFIGFYSIGAALKINTRRGRLGEEMLEEEFMGQDEFMGEEMLEEEFMGQEELMGNPFSQVVDALGLGAWLGQSKEAKAAAKAAGRAAAAQAKATGRVVRRQAAFNLSWNWIFIISVGMAFSMNFMIETIAARVSSTGFQRFRVPTGYVPTVEPYKPTFHSYKPAASYAPSSFRP